MAFNALTGLSLNKAKIPVVLPDEEVVLRACFLSLGLANPQEAKGVIAKNTKDLNRIWVSEALAREQGLTGEPLKKLFDPAGRALLW